MFCSTFECVIATALHKPVQTSIESQLERPLMLNSASQLQVRPQRNRRLLCSNSQSISNALSYRETRSGWVSKRWGGSSFNKMVRRLFQRKLSHAGWLIGCHWQKNNAGAGRGSVWSLSRGRGNRGIAANYRAGSGAQWEQRPSRNRRKPPASRPKAPSARGGGRSAKPKTVLLLIYSIFIFRNVLVLMLVLRVAVRIASHKRED